MEIDASRNYGIDLLRIISMFGVCILHTLGKGLNIDSFEMNQTGYSLFWTLEILAYNSVDVFALISGYTAKNEKKNYEKIVKMWFQVFFYSFILSVILSLTGILPSKLETLDYIRYMFPLTCGIYWYFTSYFLLFIISPFINKIIFELDEKTCRRIFVLIFFFFVSLGFFFDSFKTEDGYSPIWLIGLYCLGLLAKRIKLLGKTDTSLLIVLGITLITITIVSKVILDSDLIVSYISPFLVSYAIIEVIVFSRIKLNGNGLLKITPFVFGVYLFHLNPVVWDNISLIKYLPYIQSNILYGCAIVIIYALSLFLIGLVIDYIRNMLFKLIKINTISKKIISGITRIADSTGEKLN